MAILLNKNKPHVHPRDFEADKKCLSRLKLFQSIGPETTKILQRKMRKYADRHQPLSTKDLWRIAENNDMAEKDCIPPKKPTKITERLNHVQELHQMEKVSSDEEEDKYSRRSSAHEESAHDEEIHYTDTRSR